MKGKEIKRDTQLVIISVILLTIVSLSVSYSAFFSVESKSAIQQISTGTLEVTIDNTSAAMSSAALLPTSTSQMPSSANSSVSASFSYARLVLENTGTLDADFSVTIGYDSLPNGKTQNDLINLRYLYIGIYDIDKSEWVNFGTAEHPAYYTLITGLTPSATNIYPILKDTITVENSAEFPNPRQYKIYVWLSEETPTSQIGKLVYLKVEVKSKTSNDGSES